MTLEALKNEVRKYQHFKHDLVIDTVLASVIATRLGYGDPVWLIVIGPSAGGKSQILRPISLSDTKFIHRVDDLTENTFLSGKTGKGDAQISLLQRIGPAGIIVISDFSVIFSKAAESRGAILSQFRMIYDGEMTKFSGSRKDPIMWKGKLSMLAGATPAMYRIFEENADMGERFIHYRMKENSPKEIGMTIGRRNKSALDIDEVLKDVYGEYIRNVVVGCEGKKTPEIDDRTLERIVDAAVFAERVRAPGVFNWKGVMEDEPVPAMPGRVVAQLLSLARGFIAMNQMEGGVGLPLIWVKQIEWCAYSLINDKKRKCLRVLASTDYGRETSSQTIADKIGYSTDITNKILQTMAATGVLTRTGGSSGLRWSISNEVEWGYIRSMEDIDTIQEYKERDMSMEEGQASQMAIEAELDEYNKITN